MQRLLPTAAVRPVVPAAVSSGPRAVRAASHLPGKEAGMSRRSRLQFLFDVAQATFSQPTPPTPAQIDALRRTLSQVPLEELGLPHHLHDSSSSSRSSSPGLDGSPLMGSSSLAEAQREADSAAPRPPITYLLIYEDSRVSLGIFCLPARAKIPLHNHPGMTVLSRVLYGEMHVSSYDWFSQEEEYCEDSGEGEGNGDGDGQGACSRGRGIEQLPREARIVLDTTISAADPPVVLFPRAGGNIHEFTALTDCAVLDLMSPPYCTEDGRDCTYYAVVPNGHSASGGVVLLDSYEPPADFVIHQGHYCGVQPRPKAMPVFHGSLMHYPTQSNGSGSNGVGPSGVGGELSPTAGPAGEAQVHSLSPPAHGFSPTISSPTTVSSPTSVATGVAKLSTLLGGPKVVPHEGAPCGPHSPSAGWQETC